MVIIVHASETKESIAANMGAIDYSYYFVLKSYRKVLGKFATVIEVRNPEKDVDPIYRKCKAENEPCLFFSFTPPFKATIDPHCPTLSVFAWEYLTIPTEQWAAEPRHDWRTVFKRHGCAITHSSFAVKAVRKEMGEDFPVWSLPSPVWDEYKKLRPKNDTIVPSKKFHLRFQGVLLDFKGCAASSIHEAESTVFIEQHSSITEHNSVSVNLEGIIYTTVFNPNDGRKNWPDLLRGFCYAFREVEDVTLVMKLAYYDYAAIRGLVIHEITKLAPFKCRVVALHGFLNDRNYKRLIRNSTFVVNTAHGEGQCLPLMEYMAAGKPAVAPAHTAMEDYITEDNAFVVDCCLEWMHWPHDSRQALRSFRYRINWESLYNAFLESYQVAMHDPVRYFQMSNYATLKLKNYCSRTVFYQGLKHVFMHHGIDPKVMSTLSLKRLRLNAINTGRTLKSYAVRIYLKSQVVFSKLKMLKGYLR